MAVIRGIVFDLDDTLYLEREFVRTGFMRVAETLEDAAGLSRAELFAFLWGLFESGVRRDTFDRLLAAHPQLASCIRVEELVTTYRTHGSKIPLLPGTRELLNDLRRRGRRLGLLTDGPLACQQAKVQALDLVSLFDTIVLTDHWGREFWKPHPRGYRYFADRWGFAPQELLYVGDNPEKDFLMPRRLGWQTARLRMAGQLRSELEPELLEYSARIEITSLAELLDDL